MMIVLMDIWSLIISNIVQIFSFIGTVTVSIILPMLWKNTIVPWWNKRKSKIEEDGLAADIDQKKADKDKTEVETMRDVMSQLKIAFDNRVQLIEDSQAEMKEELDTLKTENQTLHDENKKLKNTIKTLKSIINELKGVVKKLMNGVSKLMEYYKKNDIPIPWELTLTTKEDLILKSDYTEDDSP